MYNVLKRDGKIVDFDIAKIRDAIKQAFDACEKDYNDSVIDFIALRVTADFEPKIKEFHIAVEDIQDSVEEVLGQAGYADVAELCTAMNVTEEFFINFIEYNVVVNNVMDFLMEK